MLRFILAAAGICILLVSGEALANTSFCWKETWGTGATTGLPSTCGPNQELNGRFCYDKCSQGYTSNRMTGCIQNCPSGSVDDGLFCGWRSYKAAEYPIWDKSLCQSKHPAVGCRKIGLLWVEKCKAGYKHVLGFCEKKTIDCAGFANAGKRIANSCAKKTYSRAPKRASCPAGKEFSGGFCYESCGANAVRRGPMCWGTCPPGWVECGMGCAKSRNECTDAITGQVVSVLDSAASIALLVGTAGASAAGKNIMSKAAWTGFKKLGKKKVKGALKDVLKGVAVSGAVQVPGNVVDVAGDTAEFIWDIGDIESNTTMSEIEKQHAIAEISLKSAALFDPSGIVGIVAAYTKPVCKDVTSATATSAGVSASTRTGGTGAVTAGAYRQVLSEIVRTPTIGEISLTNELSARTLEVQRLQRILSLNRDPGKLAIVNARLIEARLRLARTEALFERSKQIRANADNWLKKIDEISLRSDDTGSAIRPVARSASSEVAAVDDRKTRWKRITGRATDIAVGGDGTAWVVGSNKVAGGFGIWHRTGKSDSWTAIKGGATRIAVQGTVPWAVNDKGEIRQYNAGTRNWKRIRGPKAIDIGASTAGVWLIGEPRRGADYSIYRRVGHRWERATGAAVRVDVDLAGNPWVVNNAGQLFAFVKKKWSRFKAERAADVSVNVFGEPWVVTSAGELVRFDIRSNTWLKSVGEEAVAAATGTTTWYLDSNRAIFKTR